MNDPLIVALVSANSEWRAVKEIFSSVALHSTTLGEYFDWPLNNNLIRFFHGGWGKVSAAATTQCAIDRWAPDVIVNLGTCGGFEGRVARGTILLVTKTIVYDILEQMSDPDEAIADYSTEMDLSWLDGFPAAAAVLPSTLVSADRDLLAEDIPNLVEKYGAIASDWESGAIAWVAQKNGVRCLILRGVSDLVGVSSGGEAYGNIELFHENTKALMKTLVEQLPAWLERIRPSAEPAAPLLRKVDCLRVYVPSLESGLAFYRDRLGQRLLWKTEQAAGLRMPETDTELVLQTESQQQEVDLLVRSVEAAVQRFAQAGGTVIVPPFDIQIGRCAVVRDPWGNQLVLLDTSKGLLKTDEQENVIGNQ